MADVGVVADCERLGREVIDAFGTVDILVNNAGIFTPMPIEEVTEENWDAQHALNLKGAFFMTKAVVPTMKAKGTGKIVNISSIAGCGGFPNSSAYCATKGGLTNMTRALCLELAGDGINVNTLSPGNIQTDMNAAFRADAGIRRASGGTHALPASATWTRSSSPAPPSSSRLSDSDSVHGADLLVDNGWAAW